MKKRISRFLSLRSLALLACILGAALWIYLYRGPIFFRLRFLTPFSRISSYSSQEVRQLRSNLKKEYACVQDVIFCWDKSGKPIIVCFMTGSGLEQAEAVAASLAEQISSEEMLASLCEARMSNQNPVSAEPMDTIYLSMRIGKNPPCQHRTRYYEPHWSYHMEGSAQHIDNFQTWYFDWTSIGGDVVISSVF